jgi:hypothetical protein
MGTTIPVHSGSRWEPLPAASVNVTGAPVPVVPGDSRPSGVHAAGGPARRAARGPRLVVATLLSALALGGTGAGLALARSAEPDPATEAATTGGVPSLPHHERTGGGAHPRDRTSR